MQELRETLVLYDAGDVLVYESLDRVVCCDCVEWRVRLAYERTCFADVAAAFDVAVGVVPARVRYHVLVNVPEL